MTKKILLVDDDARFQATITPVLKNHGYTVVIATNAQEARIEAKSAALDLLVVDGQLPDFDGMTLIEEFRKDNKDTPIIFVSASWRDTDSYHKLTKVLGCRSILHKPILPSVLAQEIEKILGYSSALPVPRPSSGIALQEKLAALSVVFSQQLPNTISEIEQLIEKSIAEKKLAIASDAARKAHMLRGTAASYGFPQISNLMGKIEDTLSSMVMGSNRQSLDSLWTEVRQCLLDCRAEASKAPSGVVSDFQTKSCEEIRLSALIVSIDDSIDTMLTHYASEKKVSLARCSMASAAEQLRQNRYDIVFLDPSNDDDSHWKLIANLRDDSAYKNVPIALIKSEEANGLTQEEIYAGVDLVMSRPLAIEKMHEAFQKMLELRSSSMPRALVVDDDRNFIKRAEYLLSSEGFKVTSFADTVKLFDLLPQLKPDIFLLDIDMPGISGFDVCRKLRGSEQWHNLPVVFISARADWETRVAAFECGGDDYMSKPVVNAELMQKAHVWLQRSKARTEIYELDSLTGLLNHSTFSRRAQTLLDAQAKEGKDFAMLLLKVKNLHELNEKLKADTCDQLLRTIALRLSHRFPLGAIRGRWSGSSFALALAAPPAELEKAAATFVDELKAEQGQNINLVSRVIGSKKADSIYKLLGKEAIC